MTQYTEFEVLFYPVDKEKLRSKLKKLGARLVTPERKMRRAIVDQRFNPQFKCHFIRVRDEGDGVVRFSAKTHANIGGQIGDKKEIDVVVSDFDKTVEIIKAMGLIFDKYQETLRETWKLNNAEIDIDTWPGLETHVEIEADSEESVKKAAEILGFDWSKKIVHSRVELYGKIYGLTNEQVHDRMSNLVFEPNPFADLPKKNETEV